MKKFIIASLIGAIIMHVWSILAWMILPIHANTLKYTPAQDVVMKAMMDNNVETGVYAMPSAATPEEAMKVFESNTGKPGAAVYYVKAHPGMGAPQFIWGFIFNFIMVFAACMLLANNMNGSFFSRWWMVMMIAVIIIFGVHMLQWNWMYFNWDYASDMVLDAALGWGLNGLWLAWYLGRK